MTATQRAFRPASELVEGDYIAKADGRWHKIASVVQVTSPAAIALVVLDDGFDVGLPHTLEVEYRTAQEMEDA